MWLPEVEYNNNTTPMLAALFGWLDSSGGVLILSPDASAIALPVAGFRGGAELRLTAKGDAHTVAALLANFNKYRGPDQQIRRIWRTEEEGGEEIVGSAEVRGEMRAVVRAASLA